MDDLLGRSISVRIAIKGCLGVDFVEQESGLARGYENAHAVGIADDLVVLVVVFHQNVGAHPKANGFVLVKGVHKTRVTFAGAVNFVDAGDAKARLEGLPPDIRAKAIADHLFQGVVGVIPGRGLIHQVAAELAHIDKGIAALLPHLAEEIASGEAAAQHGAGAAQRTEPRPMTSPVEW